MLKLFELKKKKKEKKQRREKDAIKGLGGINILNFKLKFALQAITDMSGQFRRI